MIEMVFEEYKALVTILDSSRFRELGYTNLPDGTYALAKPLKCRDGSFIVDGPLPETGVFVRLVHTERGLVVENILINPKDKENKITPEVEAKLLARVQGFLGDGYLRGTKTSDVSLGYYHLHVGRQYTRVTPGGASRRCSPGFNRNLINYKTTPEKPTH